LSIVGTLKQILLVDDHPLFAEALSMLVERSFPESSVTTSTTLADAESRLAASTFDLILLDVQLPGTQGLDGVRHMLDNYPSIPVIVVSGAAKGADVAQVIEWGARGFLPKTLPSRVLASAIETVANGGTYLPADLLSQMLRHEKEQDDSHLTNLSRRETEILGLLAQGQSNKEIARHVGLQEITVKVHLSSIYRKLDVRNRVEAALHYRQERAR
jgi:DNA-binding NarL/FixJ family response regulator